MNEARELVAQRYILGNEIGAILESGSNSAENQREFERHSAKFSLGPSEREKSANPRSDLLMTKDRSRCGPVVVPVSEDRRLGGLASDYYIKEFW